MLVLSVKVKLGLYDHDVYFYWNENSYSSSAKLKGIDSILKIGTF